MKTTANNKYIHQAGFSMVELIVVIVITGILASMMGSFIARPMESYIAASRRAELTDLTDLSLRRIARDIRQALPNSIRIGGSGVPGTTTTCEATDVNGKICSLEMINSNDGGRYRNGPPGTATNILDFIAADTDFDPLANLQNIAAVDTSNDFVVIYNLTATGLTNNAYRGDNRAALSGATSASHIALSAAFLFPNQSPTQRFYLVDSSLSYFCNPSAGTVTRYSNYGFQNNQPVTAGGFGSNTDHILTNHVSRCAMTYQPGTSQRNGLVIIDLSLTKQGETVRLLHQVHLVNTP